MSIFQAIILGLVQGLTEFLPVSSSGHLAMLQYFFGITGDDVLLFAVCLHLGTLISLIAVYYKDILLLCKELGLTVADLVRGRGLRINSSEHRRLGVMIVLATIPTGIIGILFDDKISASYNSLLVIGICLLITGTMLWLVERINAGKRNIMQMKYRNAVMVGIFQAFAILPGISRSGATLTGSLLSRLNRELAVRFAFLISLPAILGAVVLEMPSALKAGMDADLILPLILGIAVAAISGFLAIKGMINFVMKQKLFYFSIYTWIVGAGLIIYTIVS